MRRPRFTVYTRGWGDDVGVADADEATSQVQCLVFLDGEELPRVVRAAARFSSGFAELDVTFFGHVEVVTCDEARWDELVESSSAR